MRTGHCIIQPQVPTTPIFTVLLSLHTSFLRNRFMDFLIIDLMLLGTMAKDYP